MDRRTQRQGVLDPLEGNSGHQLIAMSRLCTPDALDDAFTALFVEDEVLAKTSRFRIRHFSESVGV